MLSREPIFVFVSLSTVNGMRRASILIVDDEAVNLLNMKYLMEDDFEVYTATTAKTALDIVRKHEVHLILTDQKMPGMTGVDFAREVRQLVPEMPILVLTGYVDDETINEAERTGLIQEVVFKPYSEERLFERIRTYLANAGETDR
jgi:CheY-like chemotaxis protein